MHPPLQYINKHIWRSQLEFSQNNIMIFLDFCKLVASNGEVLSFLREKQVLRSVSHCARCGDEMTTQKLARSQDGFCFRCPRCKTQKSIRVGSFLVDCRLSLPTFASLLYLLQTEAPFKFLAEVLDLKPNTVTDYANLLREEYSRDLLERGEMLGGAGQRVQVDESLLAKSKATRNNHARPVPPQWVFGAYDVSRKVGWIQLVERRDTETLLPLIQQWCLPGTIIVSDGWRAYESLPILGFQHEVVVHENHFVDPNTGIHTNNVEAFWQRCKRRFKRMYGTSRTLLASHVDEFLWQDRFGKNFSDRWENTLRMLKEHYVQ
jgi:hypothetical protein